MKRTPVGAEGPRRGSLSRPGQEPSKGVSPAPPETRRPCLAPRNTPTCMVALLLAINGNGRLPIIDHHCLLHVVHHPPSRQRDRPPGPAPRRTEAGSGRSLRALSAVPRWPTGEGSVSVPSHRMRPRSKCSSLSSAKTSLFNAIPENSPNRRSHEVRRIPAPRDRFRPTWLQG